MNKFFTSTKTIAVNYTNNLRLRCAFFPEESILMYSIEIKRFSFWRKHKCNIHNANDYENIKEEDMAAITKFIAYVDKVDAARIELKNWKDSKEVVKI